MKLSRVFMVYLAVMGVILVMLLRTFGHMEYKRDIVYYNDCIRRMEESYLFQKQNLTAAETYQNGSAQHGAETYQNGSAQNETETSYGELTQDEAEELKAEFQEEYDAILLFAGEEGYAAKLAGYYQEEALVMDFAPEGAIIGKAVWQDKSIAFEAGRQKLLRSLMIFWGALLLAGLLTVVLLYTRYIRPFRELQEYTSQIAKGNLELPLPIHKNNFFGAFTESFDLLREELAAARQREYEANKSKRELVAELSHDIKTPVSSIKATCEVLQMKEQNPDTLEKVEVIYGKADTIDHLVGNLFHAALEELEVLECVPKETDSRVLESIFDKLKYYGHIVREGNVPECLVMMDALRMEQVIDNLVNNSYKYAGTDIFVSFLDAGDGITIRIRDEGPGVCEEDLARIAEKYYRGANAADRQGQGLGLYLVKWFMERQGGGMEYYNDHGFVTELYLKKA